MTTQDLRNLISAAKTGKAIEALQQWNITDSDIQNDIAMLSSRFSKCEREKNLGIVAPNEASIELNKINMALLSLIDGLDNEPKTIVQQSQTEDMKKNIFTFDNFKSTIAILAGIAGILTFYFKFCSKTPENTTNKPKAIVVYTHGEKGKQDIIQFKTTHLIADINGRRDIAQIRENGQNVFTEVSSDSISIGIDDKEGYVLKNAKNTYLVTDKPIYVEIVKSPPL